MTDNDRITLAENKALIGPTLKANLKLIEEMKRVPLCAICPAAQWYSIETGEGIPSLEAYCTTFRGVMYEPRRRIVTACDGRADAVDRQAPQRD